MVLAFWRRLEESWALFGGGLKPRVDWRTFLKRLGDILRRLEGVLEDPGGVLEASRSFREELFLVSDMVSHSFSIFKRIFSSMKD